MRQKAGRHDFRWPLISPGMVWNAVVPCLFLFLWLATVSWAGEFGGWNTLDKRLLFHADATRVSDLYNTFRGEYRSNLNQDLFFLASLDVRYYDQNRVARLADLSSPSVLAPLEISLWEAYAEVDGFLLPNLDLRLGRQRIPWGTADRLNPTDNLNPDDFTDPLDFGAKVPSTAFKATLYFDESNVEVVYEPQMSSAWFPRGDYAELFSQNMDVEMEGLSFVPDAIEVVSPNPSLEHSIWAARFNTNLLGYDLSLSYYRGMEDVPLPTSIQVTGLEMQNLGTVAEGILQLTYPALQVVGGDLAGELLGLGVWAEAGLFLPESQTLKITGIGSSPIFSATQSLDDRPYLKATVGLDRTFRTLGYVNLQWMHGFFTERGRDNLHDYLFARWERRGFQNRAKFSLTVSFEFVYPGGTDVATGLAWIPEVELSLVDSMTITLGSFFLDGDNRALFGQWRDFDQGFLQVKTSF